jgi:hypothetical protein
MATGEGQCRMMNPAARLVVAEKLLPLYKAWHIACLEDFRSTNTKSLEYDLWREVKKYPDHGLPVQITASIGRWCARQMKISITAQEWYR